MLPAWEVDMLLEHLKTDHTTALSASSQEDPFARVPDSLKLL